MSSDRPTIVLLTVDSDQQAAALKAVVNTPLLQRLGSFELHVHEVRGHALINVYERVVCVDKATKTFKE